MQHLNARLSNEDLLRLEPDVLRARLGDLIRHYARHASAELAESVVAHVEALYLQPSVCRDPEEQCCYRRFVRHWRWLAARQVRSSSANRAVA